jgi:DNA-binding beta-propeller fold protein YncE
VWTADAIASELVAGHRSQEEAQAVVATISLGGRAGQVASSPDGNCVYVLVADAVKVINRAHHIVATYRTGPDPKNIIVSADGTRLYITGYDGCTSIISTADNTVKTFVLDRLSTAEVVSADGNYIYMAHSKTIGDTQSNRISIIGADGTRVAVVPVDGHTTGLGASPDGSHLYVSARRSLSSLDWRGLITVIDTDTHRIVDKIAVELAPDTVTVSPDGAFLYATHYHNNAVSIMDVDTRAITRWMFDDAPIDLAVSPNGACAYVTNLHSLAVFDTAANLVKITSVGALPRATRLSADGKRAYVLDFDQKTIRALDTADNSIVGTLKVGGHPEAMTLTPNGEFLYLTDYRNGTATVISTARLKH